MAKLYPRGDSRFLLPGRLGRAYTSSMENDTNDAAAAPESAGAKPEPKPRAVRPFAGFSLRGALILIGLVLALGALGFAALALRSCAADFRTAYQAKAETRVYEYGYSLSREGRIVIASKSSGFVIPRDFAKKLILGLVSTAKIQIACQAVINYYVDAGDLRAAEYSWSGSRLTLRVAKPRAMRPIIETASIRQAILDRGLAFNERAELDALLSQLSDLVAASGDAGLDDATLETCRSSLESMATDALYGMRKRVSSLRVEWKE
jgi:hypothetical protein